MQEKQETHVQSLGWEDPLEEGMATHSRILAWEILWTEPSRLQSIGFQKIGHNLATENTQSMLKFHKIFLQANLVSHFNKSQKQTVKVFFNSLYRTQLFIHTISFY